MDALPMTIVIMDRHKLITTEPTNISGPGRRRIDGALDDRLWEKGGTIT